MADRSECQSSPAGVAAGAPLTCTASLIPPAIDAGIFGWARQAQLANWLSAHGF
jgi:hypothetical protein